MKWIDRTWEFNRDEKAAHLSVQILSATASKLQLLVGKTDPEQLKLRTNGKWSVNEHAGHLLTMESLWIAQLDDLVLGHENVRPWNGNNADTEAAEFNRQRLGKIIGDFEEIRMSHLNLLETYLPNALNMRAFLAEIKCDMTLADHLYFMAEHDLHHLLEIEKILRT